MRLLRIVIIASITFELTVARASEPIRFWLHPRYYGAAHATDEAQEQLAKGNLKEALQKASEALGHKPIYWPAYYIRARIYAARRNWGAALADCNQALIAEKTFVAAGMLRARVNAVLDNYSAALNELNHIVTVRPRLQYFSMALNDRAWFRATCPDVSWRNGEQAVRDAKQACGITEWHEAEPIDTLASAYAETGDFDSATRYVEQAMQWRDADEIHNKLVKHLAAFRHDRPARMNQD